MVLLTIALISAASLGYVYGLTKNKIDLAREAKKLKAIEEVVIAGYDNSPTNDMFTIPTVDGGKLEVYPAKNGNEITSLAIKSYTTTGFSGEVWLMVGLLPDGAINKISVLDQKETPGLGTKMTEDKFKVQFFGKNPAQFILKVKKDGGDVDAITAATISSRAFSDAVDRAYRAYIQHKGN